MSPEIKRCLDDRRLPYRIHRHDPIVSFEDAKAILPFEPGLMVKGLAFAHPEGPIAIIALRAADRADYKKIANALQVRRTDLRMASAEDLETRLDMQVGGVAPIPVPGAIVLVDRTVLDLDTVICGTGRRDASLELDIAAFRSLEIQLGDYRKIS